LGGLFTIFSEKIQISEKKEFSEHFWQRCRRCREDSEREIHGESKKTNDPKQGTVKNPKKLRSRDVSSRKIGETLPKGSSCFPCGPPGDSLLLMSGEAWEIE
tara:strand:+ start:27 stop:332 length:306 start_codon:yes stop_codon:yes gene_type:complete